MNRIHRKVWNPQRGQFVAVAETTRARGKSAACSAALLAGVLLAPPAGAAGLAAGALPSGGQIAAGQIAIGSSGNAMTVTQTSSKGVIDWLDFSIGSAASVNFVQPGASAITLNRVTGSAGSVVDGALTANGQVFILNPNGVLFGPGARVDTGGLVASTLQLSDADFLAGKSAFTGLPGSAGAAVVNQGSLNAADGGYIALIGQQVSNTGSIVAKLGTVALAGGNAVSLNFNGNALVGVVVSQGALDALVANGGALRADGGSVILSASGAEGLLNTVVNNSGQIQAQTIGEQAGKIVLLGANGALEVSGTLDASAPAGGNGGSIETSAEQVHIADGTRITTAAANGQTGSWLVDPQDFTVAASGGDISGATLTSELLSNNVQIQSSSGTAAGSGDINVNDTVSWSAHTLTLTAARNINVNAVMTASASASLDLEPATANGADAAVAGGSVNMGMDGSGQFLGQVNFSGSGTLTISRQLYTVINSLGSGPNDLSAGTLEGMQADITGHYALGSNIDASATAGAGWAWGSGWYTGTGFQPINTSSTLFSGVFDGLGHTVSNLTMNFASAWNSGLFGNLGGTSTANPAVVRNFGLSSLSLSCGNYSQYCGGVVGNVTQNTLLSNLSVSGNLNDAGHSLYYAGLVFGGGSNGLVANHIVASGNLQIGDGSGDVGILAGVVGTGGTVSNSTASGSIVGAGPGGGDYLNQIGGLVGNLSWGATISGSSAAVTISTGPEAQSIGGLIGEAYNSNVVTTSHATGQITVGDYSTKIGGFVGQTSGDTISSSYAAVNVVASTTGANTGSNEQDWGGFVGQSGSTIDSCFATGALTASGTNNQSFGGFGGYVSNASTTNSYATGAVTVGMNAQQIGGFGGMVGGSTLTNAYSSGAVSAGSGSLNVAGFAGTDGGGNTFAGTFWDSTASGQTTGAYSAPTLSGQTLVQGSASPATAVGLSSVQLMQQSNFEGPSAANNQTSPNFDFTNTWIIYSGRTDPLLRVFMTPLTVSVNATKVYDATIAGDLVSFSTTPDPGHLEGSLVISGAGKNVGTYTGVTASGYYSDQFGYAISYVGGAVTVTPAPLTVTASGGTQVYNGTTVAQVTLAGNVFGSDAVTISDAAATLDNKNVGNGKTVSVSGISIAGADAGNYALQNTSTTTTTNVTPAALTVTASGGSQVYNGTTVAQVTLAGNVIGSDAVTISDAGATLDNKNAGNGKTVSVSGIAISGNDAGNYTLQNTSTTTTTNVTPLAVAVAVAQGASQVYNGSNLAPASELVVSNAVTGDDPGLGGSVTLAAKNVGNQAVVGLGGLSLANPNYTLVGASAAGSVAITPRTLDLSFAVTPTVFNGSTAAAATVSDDRVVNDQFTVGFSANYADTVVGSNKPVTISNLVLSGTDASNYQLAAGAGSGVSGAITPRPITYTLAAQNPALTYTANGQTLLSPAALDQAVVASWANTVTGFSPGALSYTIWQNGQQVAAITGAGTYQIQASVSAADPHYQIAGSGNTLLDIVVQPAVALTPQGIIDQALQANAVLPIVPAQPGSSALGFGAAPQPLASNVVALPAALQGEFNAAFGAGTPLSLVSSPDGEATTTSVTLAQAQAMLGSVAAGSGDGASDGNPRDVRVPVSRSSLAEIVNGGVKLPGGVDQLLFVVKAGQ